MSCQLGNGYQCFGDTYWSILEHLLLTLHNIPYQWYLTPESTERLRGSRLNSPYVTLLTGHMPLKNIQNVKETLIQSGKNA